MPDVSLSNVKNSNNRNGKTTYLFLIRCIIEDWNMWVAFRSRTLKWFKATLCTLLICLPVAVANANIRIGTVKFDPPYVFSLDQGFEIELIKIICNRMHEKCELITMRYFELFDALQKGKIDLGIDSIPFFINTASSPYIYSYPYLLSKGQFLGLRDSEINSIMDIPPGSSIGLVKENWRADNGAFNKYFKSKFKTRFKIIPHDDIQELIDALSSGNITVAFVDYNEVKYWQPKSGNRFIAIEKPIPVADGIGIAALAKNKPLMDKVNEELKKIQNGPTYIQLYKTYISGIE